MTAERPFIFDLRHFLHGDDKFIGLQNKNEIRRFFGKLTIFAPSGEGKPEKRNNHH